MATTTQLQLDQQAGTTTATQMYSPAASTIAVGCSMFICNYTADKRKFRIFHDDDGTTYSTATALYYDLEIMGYATLIKSIGNIATAGNVAIYADANSALTFTLYGTEIDSS